MHKTASTYIQKMLSINIELLRLHGIEYPVQSSDALIKSIQKRKLDPWIKLIKKSNPKAKLLISDERLSNILAQQQEDKLIASNGNWLAKKLKPYCSKITIIGFVRDQPGFINSQFCQNTKRFSQITSSDFDAYIQDVFSGEYDMVECNPQKLFGWSLSNKLVEPIFISYNNSLSSDPFRQLINKAVPTAEQETWNKINVINKSPGRLTIHMACALKRYIREEKIYLSQKKRLYLSYLLLKKTDSLGWNKEKYNAITNRRYALIRDHYRLDNDIFAVNAWNVDKWDDVFPVQAQYTTNYRIGIFDYLKVKIRSRKFIRRNFIENRNLDKYIEAPPI